MMGLIDAVQEFLTATQDIIIAAAGEWWVLPVTYLFCVIDGFFPPVPSESIVIALGTLAAQGEGPPVWLVFPVAVLGAFTGDTIAFLIGRRIPVRRLRIFASPRGQAVLDWAQEALARRGGSFILAARYVPVGRVAVNMTAGAVGFPIRQFLGYAGIAAVLWGAFSLFIGTVAGHALEGQPLLAMAIGIALGVILGWLLDRLLSRIGLTRVDQGQVSAVLAGSGARASEAGEASSADASGIASAVPDADAPADARACS